jgi:hypothetical protein
MGDSSVNISLLWQSNVCKGMGAPLTAQVLELMAHDPAVSAVFEPVFEPFAALSPKAFLTAAVPLRALGALHFLVLSDAAPDLAALYKAGGGPRLAEAIKAAADAHPDVIARFMASPPQTNEVRRSLCLVGGFLMVAQETGLPLRCLELGASAGLNQLWDCFGYDFGALGRWGDPASAIRLCGDWSGGAPPLDAKVTVTERAACDQNPIDVRDKAAALGLLAYIWPDQPDRMARARAAIRLASASGVVVEKADAAVWAARHAHPSIGAATVIYHSIFIQYPSEPARAAILDAIAQSGAAASAAAPVAWLRMEPSDKDPTLTEVRLTLWPGGEDRLLARVHSHGAWVNWLA